MAESNQHIERYSEYGDSDCDMRADPDGEWVRWADVAALIEQLEAERELVEEAHRFALVLAELKVRTRPFAEAWLDKYRAARPIEGAAGAPHWLKEPPGSAARDIPSPASKPLCECGHSEENHHGEDMIVATRPCRATVITDAPLGGGNAYTCHCRDYVPASRPPVPTVLPDPDIDLTTGRKLTGKRRGSNQDSEQEGR